MKTQLRLMCILAHPDDESLGTGGILAQSAAEGVETYLITATRGQRGWPGDEATYPGPDALGRVREAELQAAASVLGLREVTILDYMDGELDQTPPDEIISVLVGHLRRVQPDVVVTFDHNGYYGHPDHIAIAQFTTAAVLLAADPTYRVATAKPAHRVSKLYYLAPDADLQTVYQSAFGDLVMTIDGVERRATPWADWAITTRIDTSAYWRTVWEAVACHRSQLPGYQKLLSLSADDQVGLWGSQTFYRVFSLVNGGRAVETDLFAGLHDRNAEAGHRQAA